MAGGALIAPTKTSRSTTAPAAPQTWPRIRWCRGRARTASAISTALSPERRRLRKPISRRRIQNCGPRSREITPVEPLSGLPGRDGRRRKTPEPAPPGRDRGQREEEERHHRDGPGDGPLEEDQERALRHDEALAQGVFGEVAENEREHERRQWIVELLEG